MTLELRGVDAGYDGAAVLRDVSLTVPASSVVALLGPNGAGKTTLLRVASGLLRPASGTVMVDGADVTGRSPSRLVASGLCHVPEGRGVFPALTVRENLTVFGADGAGVERAVEAFPRLGERMSQVAGVLSGGEQQMLALARAYVQNPAVVLLDEVSLGLAPKVVDEIYAFLGRLAAEGKALLLVEQFVTKALRLAEHVYLLDRGRVVFSGPSGELDPTEMSARYLGHEGRPV